MDAGQLTKGILTMLGMPWTGVMQEKDRYELRASVNPKCVGHNPRQDFDLDGGGRPRGITSANIYVKGPADLMHSLFIP